MQGAQSLPVNSGVTVRVIEVHCESQLMPSVLRLLQGRFVVLCLSVNFLFLKHFYLVTRLFFGVYCTRLGIGSQNQGVRSEI